MDKATKQPSTSSSDDSLADDNVLSDNVLSDTFVDNTHKQKQLPLWIALILTLTLIITIREAAFIICQSLGYASAANIVGMLTMFVLLMIWRLFFGLPEWLTQASNTLLLDSGFAFLPVSAGAGLLLFGLGDEFWGIMSVLTISTLVAMWGLAKLTDVWLERHQKTITKNTIESCNNDS